MREGFEALKTTSWTSITAAYPQLDGVDGLWTLSWLIGCSILAKDCCGCCCDSTPKLSSLTNDIKSQRRSLIRGKVMTMRKCYWRCHNVSSSHKWTHWNRNITLSPPSPNSPSRSPPKKVQQLHYFFIMEHIRRREILSVGFLQLNQLKTAAKVDISESKSK